MHLLHNIGKESFNDYLNQLFNFDKLDEEEVLMLKQLSVLPSIEITLDNLQLFLGRDNDTDFEDLLIYLTEKAWLISVNGRYKLHSIIKEYIFNIHPPKYIDIEVIVEFFNKFLSSSNINVTLFMKNNIVYLDSILNVIFKFKYGDQNIVKLLNFIGHIYSNLSLYSNAQKSFEQALLILETTNIIDKEIKITTYNNTSDFYTIIEEYELALELSEKAIIEAEKTWNDKLKLLTLYLVKANTLYGLKDFSNALLIYEEIINIRVAKSGENNLDVAKAFSNLGSCQFALKDYPKASKCFLKANQIYMDVYMKKHPDMIIIFKNLAETLMFLENHDDALICYQNSLDMAKEFWGEDNLSTASVYYSFSKFYFKIKDYGTSLNYMQKAIAIQKRFLSENHTELHNSIEGLKLIEQNMNTNKVKIGRNSLCPCRSGKKYKRCCGKK